MQKSFIFLVFGLILFPGLSMSGFSPAGPPSDHEILGLPDSVENQILFNGRAWRNLYYNIQGDQFLYSDEFYPGTVTIAGRNFSGILLKYDIYNDEIITVNSLGMIIQLNKEMIEKFSLTKDNETFFFQKLDTADSDPFPGYVNVLYDGEISLFVRYRKEILQHTGDAVFSKFNQIHRIYLVKGVNFSPLGSRRNLLDFMNDKRLLVRSFIRNNKIKVTKKDPASFVPVVKYYNSLVH